MNDGLEDAMPRRPPKVIRPAAPREKAALDAALAASFSASDPVAATLAARFDARLTGVFPQPQLGLW